MGFGDVSVLRPLVVAGDPMRLVSFGLLLLLASGPVFAQQSALTPAQADCPPGEPDTLQISWTQLCDSGGWLFDTQAGCRMWDWHPAPEDSVVWLGACHGHLPNGQGEAQWFEHGRPINRFIGTFRNGKRDGEERAIGYIDRIEECCRSLAVFPNRGTRRDDLRSGLRILGFERRALIAFRSNADTVTILRVLYGWRDVEAAIP